MEGSTGEKTGKWIGVGNTIRISEKSGNILGTVWKLSALYLLSAIHI